MEVSVWDTYVQREDGKIMHFDVLVPSDLNNEQQIFDYGNVYLSSKSFKTSKLTTDKCKFCHIELAPQSVIDDILNQGYSIIEMENCN